MLFDLEGLVELIDGLYPRFLSQIDRDPDSPTFGSCDRQFWMYRLHDFDSGVLQQGGLTFASLARLAQAGALDRCRWLRPDDAPAWRTLAHAVNLRTARLLTRNGFLDEYYPGERSFPGTVFAAYATLASAHQLDDREVVDHPGLRRCAEALVGRAPSPAANQDQGAAAFLALYARLHDWRRAEVARTVDGLLAGPDGAGRFVEYGGADLGYMTVSLNGLGAMDADGSHPVTGPLGALARVIADFVSPSGKLGGEYASRSTTYFLPFGLLRAARAHPELVAALGRLDVAGAFARLDDRYLAHYTLASLSRAAADLAEHGPPEAAAPYAPPPLADHRDRGVVALRRGDSACFVGVGKGGTFQLENADGVHVDCGYRVRRGDVVYASAVLHAGAAEVSERVIRVVAPFQRYRSLVASPAKTVVLRGLGFAGPSLNAWFKRRLITEPAILAGAELHRELRLVEGELVVTDEVRGLGADDRLTRAPAVSFRLVPSARFHQPGELAALTARGPAPTRSERRFGFR